MGRNNLTAAEQRALVEQHIGHVWNVAKTFRHRASARADVEDFAMIGFESVLKRIPSWDGVFPFRWWVKVQARQGIAQWFQEQNRHQRSARSEAPLYDVHSSREGTPADILTRRETIAELAKLAPQSFRRNYIVDLASTVLVGEALAALEEVRHARIVAPPVTPEQKQEQKREWQKGRYWRQTPEQREKELARGKRYRAARKLNSVNAKARRTAAEAGDATYTFVGTGEVSIAEVKAPAPTTARPDTGVRGKR